QRRRDEHVVGDAPALAIGHLNRLATGDHALDLGALAVAAAGGVPVVAEDVEPPVVALDVHVLAAGMSVAPVRFDALECLDAVARGIRTPEWRRCRAGPRLGDREGDADSAECEGAENGSAGMPAGYREWWHGRLLGAGPGGGQGGAVTAVGSAPPTDRPPGARPKGG